MEKLLEIIEKYWLKPISTLFLAIVLFPAYKWLASSLINLNIITPDKKYLQTLAVLFAAVLLIYFFACLITSYANNRLPRASKGKTAVLFCIDAESQKLFDAAKYKLVNNFENTIRDVGQIHFQALCVPREKLSKYNLQQKDAALTILQRTNCALLVQVRYTADNVDNAESFELKIDYGIRHPAFHPVAELLLAHDMTALGASVGKQRFVKADTIDVFNFTTRSLVCACQYIVGIVALLNNSSATAYALLSQARSVAVSEFSHMQGIAELLAMIDDRIYMTLCQLTSEYFDRFKSTKLLDSLQQAQDALQRANSIHPDTLFYNINMAYIYIILDQNAESAKRCVEKCKLSKGNTVWMYSEAFLSAYSGLAPGTIFAKYKKAFATPYKSLSELVEYIEFVIEREPDKLSLHLAAALVYEEMGDQRLMKHHFSVYMRNATKLDRRTREKIEAKIGSVSCKGECEHDCSRCTDLTA